MTRLGSGIHSLVYAFAYRGDLSQESLDRAGRRNRRQTDADIDLIKEQLSLRLLDQDRIVDAEKMAAVFIAITAFENSARELIIETLLEEVGEGWWHRCISKSVRDKAEKLKNQEQKFRFHTQRGSSLINYTQLGDLANIVTTNWQHFEDLMMPGQDWVKQIFSNLERSRNIIMHSGYLAQEDIQRVGMSIRDWTRQVGT